MEEAAAVRDGAREVLAEITPPALRREATQALDDGWPAPGVVAVLAARRAGVEGVDADLRERAIGVQLIYEGLALTRRLVEEAPWADTDDPDPHADVEVLVADVLVSRGSYLLSYTEAADRCVEVIRAFGRRETERPADADWELEADALALGAVAGATAGGEDADDAAEWAASLSASLDGDELPDPADFLGANAAARVGQPAVANEWRQPSTDP
jgi:hypothetical protein